MISAKVYSPQSLFHHNVKEEDIVSAKIFPLLFFKYQRYCLISLDYLLKKLGKTPILFTDTFRGFGMLERDLIIGIIAILWGRKEEGAYYGSVSEHVDVREFVDRNPLRPEPIALKIGGRICIAIGIVLLLISGGFYLWGTAPTP
jgi:hypothetical protein